MKLNEGSMTLGEERRSRWDERDLLEVLVLVLRVVHTGSISQISILKNYLEEFSETLMIQDLVVIRLAEDSQISGRKRNLRLDSVVVLGVQRLDFIFVHTINYLALHMYFEL